jgi:hypothetical protein
VRGGRTEAHTYLPTRQSQQCWASLLCRRAHLAENNVELTLLRLSGKQRTAIVHLWHTKTRGGAQAELSVTAGPGNKHGGQEIGEVQRRRRRAHTRWARPLTRKYATNAPDIHRCRVLPETGRDRAGRGGHKSLTPGSSNLRAKVARTTARSLNRTCFPAARRAAGTTASRPRVCSLGRGGRRHEQGRSPRASAHPHG